MQETFGGSGEWLRCALHAHTTRSDGELAPESLAAHYARAGYDVLAITDHWRLTDAESSELLVLASSELNCILPEGRDGHVLAYGIEDGPGPARRRVRRSRAHGRLDRGARRRRLPRTPTLVGGDARPTRAARRTSTGSRSSTPAASSRSGVASRASTGTSCSKPGRAASRSPPTTRTIPASTPISRGRGCGSRAVLATRCSRRCARARTTRAPVRSVRGVELDGDAVEVRCSPCRSVTLVGGTNARRCRARRQAAVLPSRARARAGRRRRGSLAPGSSSRSASDYVRRRACGRRRAGGRGRTRTGGERARTGAGGAGRTPVRPARHRRRDRRRRDRGRGGAHRARRRARRAERLRRCDLERSSKLIHGGLRYLRLGDVKLVREAHQRAARAARGRRAAPRPPAAVPVPALPRWPVTGRSRSSLGLGAVLAARRRPGRWPRRRRRGRAAASPISGSTVCAAAGSTSDAWTNDAGSASRTCGRRRTRARRCSTTPRSRRCGTVGGRDRRRRGARPRDGCRRAGRRARGRERDRAVGRPRSPSRGPPARGRPSRSRRACTCSCRSRPGWSAALTIPHDRVRVSFAVPWAGQPAARDDGRAVRGRPGPRRADGRRCASGRRRSVTRRAGGGGCPGEGALRVRGPARAAGRRRETRPARAARA